MVTSDFRPEVEIWPFRACAMKNMQYITRIYGRIGEILSVLYRCVEHWSEIDCGPSAGRLLLCSQLFHVPMPMQVSTTQDQVSIGTLRNEALFPRRGRRTLRKRSAANQRRKSRLRGRHRRRHRRPCDDVTSAVVVADLPTLRVAVRRSSGSHVVSASCPRRFQLRYVRRRPLRNEDHARHYADALSSSTQTGIMTTLQFSTCRKV